MYTHTLLSYLVYTYSYIYSCTPPHMYMCVYVVCIACAVLPSGMGTVTQQLAAAAVAAGVKLHTACKVASIAVEGGLVRGVVLEDGTTVAAKAVVGGCGELLFFLGGAAGGVGRCAGCSFGFLDA